jgi:hypothetical protein
MSSSLCGPQTLMLVADFNSKHNIKEKRYLNTTQKKVSDFQTQKVKIPKNKIGLMKEQKLLKTYQQQ